MSIRSKSYKNSISSNDNAVILTSKETGEDTEGLYMNCFGRIYYYDKDIVTFIKDEALSKYHIYFDNKNGDFEECLVYSKD